MIKYLYYLKFVKISVPECVNQMVSATNHGCNSDSTNRVVLVNYILSNNTTLKNGIVAVWLLPIYKEKFDGLIVEL
jgi:hypothetical protein